MATIITYPSAMEYWLKEQGIPYHFHFDLESASVKNSKVLRKKYYRSEILKEIEELKFSNPVHVLVSEKTTRYSTDEVVFHKMPEQLPANCFLKITEDIYICSPEYCFLQAAECFSVPELVLLANDLCAIYLKDPENEYLQRSREAVTSVRKIQMFLSQAKQIRGIQKAGVAIKYALDRSNSPMESRLGVIACLPISRGGYGLPAPLMNDSVRMVKEAIEYLGRETCCCDMVWYDQKVILEYDSTLSHLSKEQHILDKNRLTALTISGYKVISATADQVKSFGSIETLFLNLRKELKLRTYRDRMDKYYDLRREVVKQLLFVDRMEDLRQLSEIGDIYY